VRFSGQEFILLHGPWPRTMLSPKWRTKQQVHTTTTQHTINQHQIALQVPDNQLRQKQAQQIAGCPMQLSLKRGEAPLSPSSIYNLKLCYFKAL